MNVQVIKDEIEYKAALEKLSALMDKSFVPGSEAENLIELLQIVLKDYEEKHMDPIELDPIQSFIAITSEGKENPR